MDMKIIGLLFFFLLVCVGFVVGEDSYPGLGGVGSDYFSGDQSLFNGFIEDDNIADIVALNSPHGVPLVSDLDGDGINEIVVLSGGTVGIYQASSDGVGISLDGVGGVSTGASVQGDYFSNMVVFDISGDGNKEVLVHSQETGSMTIVSWNGSHALDISTAIHDFYVYWDASNNGRSGDSMLGCGGDWCVLVYNNKNWDDYWTTQVTNAFSFNMSHSFEGNAFDCNLYNKYREEPTCFPKLGAVPYVNDKFYFTASGGNIFYSRFSELSINDSGHCEFITSLQDFYYSPSSCARGITSLTSPTPVQFSIDPGYELGYASAINSNEFKIFVYKSDMTLFDDYPEIQNAIGEIMSNPFVAGAFIDTDESDLCVVGFDDDAEKMDILCASASTSVLHPLLDNVEFIYETDAEFFNVSALDIYSNIAHSIESVQANHLSEILTPFGVFELEDYSQAGITSFCYLNGLCDATRVWSQPTKTGISLISVDVLDEGFEDLVGLTSSQLLYIDDGFLNLNAYLGYCTKIEPSIDAVWQIHEEDSIGVVSRLPYSYDLVNGTVEGGDVISLHAYDSEYLVFKEELVGGHGRYEAVFNFGQSCDGDINRMNISLKTSELPDADDSRFFIYNYFYSNWDFLESHSLDDYDEFNLSILLPSDLTNYLENGSNLKFMHSDTAGVNDPGLNEMHLNYMELSCSSVVSGNKSNEVRVRVKPIDPEGDIVSARVILYYGESNEQDTGWSANFSSGTEIPFSGLLPNALTSGSTLRIMWRDSNNYYVAPLYQDFSFRVQSTGHLRTDSNSCEGITEEQYESGLGGSCDLSSDCLPGFECISGFCVMIPSVCDRNSDCPDGYVCNDSFECEALPTEQDNKLIDSAKDLSLITGIPLSVLILIILGAVIFGIFREPAVPNNVKLPVSIILGLLAVGVAVKLGLLGYIWIVLFVLAVLGGIAVLVGRVISRG